MKTIVSKQYESQKTQPKTPSGSLKIAGEQVSIGVETVSSKSGSPAEDIIKRLRAISKKSPFNPPVHLINE